MNFIVLGSICLISLLFILRMVQIFYELTTPVFISFDEMSATEFSFENLSCSEDVVFSYSFFHLRLFDVSRFWYLSFHFFKRSSFPE